VRDFCNTKKLPQVGGISGLFWYSDDKGKQSNELRDHPLERAKLMSTSLIFER